MGYLKATADFDAAVMEAGDRFVTQVQPVVRPQSLAVILLDPEGDTGRVAFTWGHPHQFGSSQNASLAHAPSSTDVPEHSLRISLEGQEGTLGAVLFRGDFPYGYNQEQPLLLRSLTQQLALTLENIQLKERLRRKLVENQVYDNIASLVAGELPPGTTYRRFAAEIKKLIGAERITFYQADPRFGDLIPVFQIGVGAGVSEASAFDDSLGADWKSRVSSGEGIIVHDKSQTGPSHSSHLDDAARMRAALIVPIIYGGNFVGAVTPESNWPNAYGRAELVMISKAAAFLGPWIANASLKDRLQGKANELAVMDGLGRVAGSYDQVETVFSYMAEALKELTPFECATVTWIESDGSDLSTLHWPGEGNKAVHPNNGDRCRLESRLVFGKQEIGAVALTRSSDLMFTAKDLRTLERFARQIAPIVQSARLERQGLRQAVQIQRLTRDCQTHESASFGVGGYPVVTSDAVQELRTPLTAIKGYSSALLQSDVGWPPEIYREFLETIDRETDRLNHMIGSLSPAVQDQPDLSGPNIQSCGIENLFDRAQDNLGLADWPMAVRFRCQPGLPPALVDPVRLVRALCHLIRCAAEFVQTGEAILVEACLRRGRTTIVIGVGGQTQPSEARVLSQKDSPFQIDTRLDRRSLRMDFRVVVSRNLLAAHDVKLSILPERRPSEVFSFSIPHR